jgi:hypothetical protein
LSFGAQGRGRSPCLLRAKGQHPTADEEAKGQASTNGTCPLRSLDPNFPLDSNEPGNDQVTAADGDPAASSSAPTIAEAQPLANAQPTADSEASANEGAGDPLPQPPPEPKPQDQWILGDDGIAIRLVNGQLPPHLRHRYRHMKF